MPLRDDPRAAGLAPSGLHGDQIALLDESLRLLGADADEVVAQFYATLFAQAPQLRALFPPEMYVQRDRLVRGLFRIVALLHDPAGLEVLLHRLGSDHRTFGVRPEDYEQFTGVLIATLRHHQRDIWLDELEEAWTRALDVVSRLMVEGAQESARVQPAWWRAEIIAHERRTEDLAVIVARPDRPYAYRAGQYATLETPHRPRSRRPYSLAAAPSPDGLLEFHVRALGAGWVSGALVRQARVGDVLRLGAPRGEMRIDQHSRRDVLAVAGGTGLAPVKALVDDMAKWNTSRAVTVFFGARRADDLYDLPALERMASVHPWLHVVPAVSDDRTYAGERGMLPEVVLRHGRWTEHDVVVSGPARMTRATFRRLTGAGVPAERIAVDPVDGAHPAAAKVIDLRGHQRGSVRRRGSRSADGIGRPRR